MHSTQDTGHSTQDKELKHGAPRLPLVTRDIRSYINKFRFRLGLVVDHERALEGRVEWWAYPDSNGGPPRCQRGALTS